MRIVHYTKEQLDNGTIILIKFPWNNPSVCEVLPVEVVKSTAKQIVTHANGVAKHMTADKFGLYDWSGIYCLQEDVEEIIKEYKILKTEKINSKISALQKELDEVKNLKLKEEISHGN